MPIIKDPIHNHQQGQFGVVFVETLGAKGELAVYDKSSKNDLRPLPSGWEVTLVRKEYPELDKPYFWCNIPIKYLVEIVDIVPVENQGPISKKVKKHIENDAHFGSELKKPDSSNSIYPWKD